MEPKMLSLLLVPDCRVAFYFVHLKIMGFLKLKSIQKEIKMPWDIEVVLTATNPTE